MFRRLLGGSRPIKQGNPANVPAMLERANQLMANGGYAEAAEIFKELAQIAFARNGPRAPIFFVQAGRALVLSGKTNEGMESIKRGLAILSSHKEWKRFQNSGNEAITDLKKLGLTDKVREIGEIMKGALPPGFIADSPAKMNAKRAVLPPKCPSCGAVMRPNEVTWLDDLTAECAYCGSPVRGQS